VLDTRLEMASTWFWWHKQRNRVLGEPVVDPFCQQPADVTEPVTTAVAEVIRSMDVYDSTRDIIRVDLRRVPEVTARLYETFHSGVPTEKQLNDLEGAVKIMLHHLKVEGDAPE
jgi:hypothetical protein